MVKREPWPKMREDLSIVNTQQCLTDAEITGYQLAYLRQLAISLEKLKDEDVASVVTREDLKSLAIDRNVSSDDLAFVLFEFDDFASELQTRKPNPRKP